MDSVLDRHPFWDALAALAASDSTDKELRKLLSYLGNRRATSSVQSTEWGEEEDFWKAATAEGDGSVLAVPLTRISGCVRSPYFLCGVGLPGSI